MTKSIYYVSLFAPKVTEDYYDNAATMVSVMEAVFVPRDRIASFTKAAKLDACHTELEVALLEDGLIGRAIIEMDAAQKVALDKTKLSNALKSLAPWVGCKVEKRAVEADSEGTEM